MHGHIIIKKPRYNPYHIAIHYGDRFPKRHRGNGGGGIIAYSRQFFKIFKRRRKPAAVFMHHPLSRLMHQPRTAIISKTFPELHQVFFASYGQIVDPGKGFQNLLEVRQTLLYTCLLKDDFTQPNRVWITGTTPG